MRILPLACTHDSLSRSSSRWRLRGMMLFLSALFLPVLVQAEQTAPENYKKHCTKCHGPDGKSETRLGRKSGAKDLSDKQAQGKMTDEDAFKGIKFGRKNSKGEEKMDSFGDVLSDQEISDLVAYVRTLAK